MSVSTGSNRKFPIVAPSPPPSVSSKVGSSGFWKRSSKLRAPNISSVDRTRVNSFYSTVVVIKFC
ncbi:unnamed protein product [Prunus armeniaca]